MGRKLTAILIFPGLLFLISSAFAQFSTIPPEYIDFIYQKVYSYISYPREALDNGWEGLVKVKLVLDPLGDIREVYIVESSGFPELDAAALAAVQDAGPFPLPQTNTDREVEITIPINYVHPDSEPLEEMKEEIISAELPSPGTVKPIFSSDRPLASPFDLEIPQMYEETPPVEQATLEPEIETPVPGEGQETEAPVTPKQPPVQYSSQHEQFLYEPQRPVVPTPDALIRPIASAENLAPIPDDLNYYVDLALKNHQPTQIAKEEIELAQIKVTEAQRSFLPNVKITGTMTEGEIYRVKYAEREVKTNLDQPVYTGGRLKDTLDQARVNLEISRKNYDRLKSDVINKTEIAYYNLVSGKMHLAEKLKLREEAVDLYQKIKKLADGGMVIELEVNSAKSWLEQLDFQISSIKQDILMAELTFRQVINAKDDPSVQVKAETFDLKKLDLEMPDYIQIALKNRPELYLSGLRVKFDALGRKIEEIKNRKMSIDAVTSAGYYQGHYLTEPWKGSSNWYAGLKGSIPWGRNTINTNLAYDHTRPRFGQTSATQSTTFGTELNVLDNFKRVADLKKANVDLDRSLSDFDETTKTVAFEVQEAFLNYQKAVLQLDTAQADMKFRRNEAEVTKVRAMTGEGNLSAALESLYSLSDSQSKYYQALANCQITICNLKKACGYGVQI